MQRKDEKIKAEVAMRIKKLRQAKEISQEEAYLDTDIHFGRIEAGRSNITVSTLHSICNYFGITMSEFFDGIDN